MQRVFWADDHVTTLRAVRVLLESRFELVGTATDGQQAVDAIRKLRPEVVVLDISMPTLSGIDVARHLLASESESESESENDDVDQPIVAFLSIHRDAAIVEAALETGALGYVLKTSAGQDLLDAIEQALAGRRFISPVLCAN